MGCQWICRQPQFIVVFLTEFASTYTWKEPEGILCTVGISTEIRTVQLLSAMQKQYCRAKLLGTERSNDKRTVIDVQTFCNRWLGASVIAGCNTSLIYILQLDDVYFLRRKMFWTLYQVFWRSDNTFHFNGQNRLSCYWGGRRSCGLVFRLALYQQSVYCMLNCTELSNTIEFNTITVKRKSKGEALIAWTKHI